LSGADGSRSGGAAHAAMIDPVRDTYDAVAEPYAEHFAAELSQKPLDRCLIDAFAGQVRQSGDGHPVVADLGCGPGHTIGYLRDLGLPVVGIDLSPRMLAQARARYPGLDVREGSILDLAADDESWAGVLSLYSVIHLPPEVLPLALREFHRVLRPGGVLLLGFHVGDQRVHLDTWFDRPVCIDGYLFDVDTVAGQLEDAGFDVRARVRRRPYPGIEVPTERAYLFARRPVGDG
jgi:SAM-dependent methyltransferase